MVANAVPIRGSTTSTKKPRKRRSRLLLGCLIAAGLFVVPGIVGTIVGLIKGYGAVGGEPIDPSQKARILGETISAVMNCTAFAMLVGLGVGAGVLVWWLVVGRQKRPDSDDQGEDGESGSSEPPSSTPPGAG